MLSNAKLSTLGVCSEKLRSKEFNLTFLKMAEIAQLIWMPKDTGDEEFNARLARAVDLYESLAPSDGGEGMLAAQMVGTHHAALECLRRAALPGQTFEGRDMALKHASKLMALYEKQLKTLNASRGKGQQKVTVEHVHVAAGGQAIVGTVETGKAPAHRSTSQSEPKAIESGQMLPTVLGEQEMAEVEQVGT